MKVGIIIVTYNSQLDIARLLDSIIIQRYNELAIYIVDNNSKDDTLNIIRDYQSLLPICVISSKENNGFAKGNNIGIKRAMNEGCDLLFILNPDIQLEEQCIDILVKRIMLDERIAVIGPIVLYGNDPDNSIQAYGVNANFKSQKKYGPIAGQVWSDKLPPEIYVDFVLGGAMMIRSTMLKITGLFEEDYFMYNDELDIAYRIKKAGFKTLCLRDAIVRHFHDFTPKNRTGYNIMYYYVIRNRYLYFKKFHLYFNLLSSLLGEIASLPQKIIWSIRRMNNFRLLKYYYTGLLDGLSGRTGIANISFDSSSKAKEILLTIDYELFLGKVTGKVKETMIEPTQNLLSILEKNNSTMTVFWDVLHYYRLLELEKNNSELKEDRLLIENQILEFAEKGHDIQLHLHPHWLDTKYKNNEWVFYYERFKLHNLSMENNPEDINTILGCVTITKTLMETLIRKIKPGYKVTTFRAGGYLIEPFSKLKDTLIANHIKIDSSVCPDLVNVNGIFSFDFESYPDKQKYNFEFSPKDIENTGSFTEIPITTVKIPALIYIYYSIIRRIKYSDLESERKGIGTGDYFHPPKFHFIKKLLGLSHTNFRQLTTDSSFKERFLYKIKKIPDHSTMILHPKLLNNHSLKFLDEYVSANKIHFISIQKFVT